MGVSFSNILQHSPLQDAYVFADASFAQKLEQFELSEGPQTEHRVLKRSDLLDCDLPATGPMDC